MGPTANHDGAERGVSIRLTDPQGSVLIIRRSSPPFEGTWALPGGRVEAADRAVAGRRVSGDPELAAARVAAVREGLEELGLLIGVRGAPVDPGRLRPWRERLRAGEVGLEAVLEALHLTLDPERLVPGGRLTLAEPLPARWRLQVLEVDAPPTREVHPEPGEVAAHRWATPAEIAAEWARGDLILAPGMPAVLGAMSADRPGFELVRGIWGLPLRAPTLPPATHTNTFVLGTGAHRLLVDPGSPWPEDQAHLDAALEGDGVAGVTVCLTHHHLDHVGGAAHLKARWSARVLAHPATAALLPPGLVDGVLTGGPLPAGPGAWSALHTPGHAPGHLSLFDPGTGVVLVGDLMAGIGTVVIDPPEGDLAAYLDSLARVGALGARLALPAHGPPIGDVAERIAAYQAHRQAREDAIVAALAAGAERPVEVVPMVYTDVPEALHPLAARSVLAHLLKMEGEGRLRRLGEDTWRLTGPGILPPD